MKQLRSLTLVFVAIVFIITSCYKGPEAPALGDYTVPQNPGGAQTNAGKKVLSLGADWGDIFQTGPNGILYVRNKSKFIKVYTPDNSGVFGTGAQFPGDAWEASASMYYMGMAQNVQTVFVANAPPAGLFRFDVGANGFLTMHPTTNPADPWPTNFGFWYGDGWNNYDLIAFNGKFVFQIAHNEGESLLRSEFQNFTNDWSTWNRPATLQRDDTGKKFSGYRAAMAMKNSLLIVTAGGDLMAYVVDDNGNLDSGKKIGAGWNVYNRIAAAGDDILAVAANGEVYRYAIDLTKTTNDANKP